MEDKLTSNALRRIQFICKRNVSKVYTTLFYVIVVILGSQLDFALATDGSDPVAGQPGSSATTKPGTTSSSKTTAKSVVVVPNANATSNDGNGAYDYGNMLYDRSTLRRSFFVLIGFTCLAIVFFAVRWFRSRGKRKSKKYGVLATRSSDMELRPLDQEDDEEDMTVFDVNSK